MPTHWRLHGRDTEDDPLLHPLIERCDVLMPWFVGRYNDKTFPEYAKIAEADLAWCRERGLDYAPLAFPGFSWHNMRGGQSPSDQIPRDGGRFYWRQLSSYIGSGAEMLYLAMFDEIDEGTAIFKVATEAPVSENGTVFVPLDAKPGSDHYLFLAGEAGRMMRGERKFSRRMPTR